MTEEGLRDYAIEQIVKAIEMGETHGAFSVYDDETGNEHYVDWDLNLDVEFMEDE